MRAARAARFFPFFLTNNILALWHFRCFNSLLQIFGPSLLVKHLGTWYSYNLDSVDVKNEPKPNTFSEVKTFPA